MYLLESNEIFSVKESVYKVSSEAKLLTSYCYIEAAIQDSERISNPQRFFTVEVLLLVVNLSSFIFETKSG